MGLHIFRQSTDRAGASVSWESELNILNFPSNVERNTEHDKIFFRDLDCFTR